MLECVVNVSEGRRSSIIRELGDTIKNSPGVNLIHIDSGFDANRTVFTFLGSETTLSDAIIRLLKTCLLVVGLAWFLFSGCTTIAPGHDHHHHTGVRVYDAWVRAVPPNMKMTAAYMSLHNHSEMEDALVSAETPVAGVVETHTVKENNGVMSMKPVYGKFRY